MNNQKRGSVPSVNNTKATTTNGPSMEMIEEIKAKIKAIFEENKEQISAAKEVLSVIQNGSKDEYAEANESYQKAIDELYQIRDKKTDEVNERYGDKIYKLKEYYDMKTGDKVEYNSVLDIKNNELKTIEDDFNAGIIKIKEEYKLKMKSIQGLYEAKPHLELIEGIKNKIDEVIHEHSESQKQANDNISNEKKPVSNKVKK